MSSSSPAARPPAPWLWFFLNLPFGATSGFVTVALAYAVSHAGFDDDVVAGLVAMNLLPHTWKFLWAPVVDMTLTRKRWYRYANLLSCVTLAAMGLVPIEAGTIGLLTAIAFMNSVFISFLGMSVEGLMAHTTPPDALGRAAGWFQAGNLGGSGLGGGLALLIAQEWDPMAASIITSVILFGCSFFLGLLHEPIEARGQKVSDEVKRVAKDVWSVIARRTGIVALTLCVLPLCAGAAANFFSPMAAEWHASDTTVELVQGLMGGLLSAFGCILGGRLSDAMTRRTAYLVSGALLAAVAIFMAILPRTEANYAIFCSLYNLATGICYGAFTGFVLEVIGKGAAATKYNALASLSNVPIFYMTLVLGAVSTASGREAMLWVDAATGLGGVLVLFIVAWALGVGGRAPAPAAAS